MYKIGFVGVPGSGKTSTARALAAFCRREEDLKRVELISEYARRYITKYGITSLADQYRVMYKQLEWENVIPEKDTDILITDSPIHLGFIYALDLRQDTPKDAMYMNDIFKTLTKLNNPRRYDLIFYLPPVIEPVPDGVREKSHFTKDWREKATLRVLSAFDLFPPKKFVTIEAIGLKERVEESKKHIFNMIDEGKSDNKIKPE